ncbi:MAG: phospholipid carrier-dependent glycosyltransferase, partial [Terriglobales bacterium]
MNPSSAGSRQLRRNPWLEIFLLVAFCGFLFFFGLNSVGLVGADEPRYAQISREMLNRRDWVTPLLNGKPWLEKPVLYYWETMLSYALTGVSDWSARLPGAINASACVLAVYLFMWRFVGRGTKRYGVQLDAALILASCAFIVGFGRAGSTDMPLTASVTIAMLCWIQWWLERDGTEPRRRGRWLVGFYGFLALGTLAKGPVAPLLAAVIIVCFAALRRKREVLQATAY